MNETITLVETGEQIAELASLAREIWNEYFVSMVGQEQVDYMLNKFHSPDALKELIESGYEYYTAFIGNEPVGYIALAFNDPPGKTMLSKLYVKKALRGTGLGSTLLEFSKSRAADASSSLLWLTVNRYNEATIAWYRKKGFTTTDKIKKPIGGGFFMDDFIMEMPLAGPSPTSSVQKTREPIPNWKQP